MVSYKKGFIPITGDIIDLYISSGINRPVHDSIRIKRMYDESNLIITAWHKNMLVGIARSLTDFCYCCYLSDLAVRKEFQKQGIGHELIKRTREAISDQSMLLLLSAPGAMSYYPKLNFEKVENGFILKRTV